MDELELITNLVTPAAYLSVLTAVLLLFGRDWRALLPIVLAQYAAVALVLSESLTLYLAFSKVMVGLFVTLILYVTVRQLFAGGWSAGWEQRLLSWPLQLGVTVVIVVAGWLLARQTAGELSASYLFAAYSLLGLGVWGFLLTTRPLRIGLGLLLVLSGVELLYLGREAGLLAAGFLAVAHLITTVVVAYLAQTKPIRLTEQTLTVKTDQ